MNVRFVKVSSQHYSLTAEWPDRPPVPCVAAGNDAWLPHELVHFVVEAELALTLGVFGRIAAGGSQRVGRDTALGRKQRGRLERLNRVGHSDMARSEEYASRCEVLWRLRRGLLAEPPLWLDGTHAQHGQDAAAEKVLARLDLEGTRWHELPVGGSMLLSWPHPVAMHAASSRRR